MTNEQAINELKDWQTAFSRMDKDMSYAIEAFDVAIKALEEKSVEPVGCDGCVHNTFRGFQACDVCSRAYLDRYIEVKQDDKTGSD